MDNRYPDNKCRLCQIKPDLATSIWELWIPEESRKLHKFYQDPSNVYSEDPAGLWINKIQDLMSQEGFPVIDSQEIVAHFEEHGPEQPKPKIVDGKIENALYGLKSLKGDPEKIVDMTYRLQGMTTSQILDTLSESTITATVDYLNQLAQSHFLFRYIPDSDNYSRRGAETVWETKAENLDKGEQVSKRDWVWFLGKAGVPYIQEIRNPKRPPTPIMANAEVKRNHLIHDLKVVEVGKQLYVALKKSSQDQQLGNLTEMNLKNWYGPSPQVLPMRFFDPFETTYKLIHPDSFLSLSVHYSQHGVGEIPLFVEFDNGSKHLKELCKQYWAYSALAASGTAGKRFYELEDYCIPVVFIVNGSKRIENSLDKFIELYPDIPKQRAATFIVSEKEWLNDPITAQGISLWDYRLNKENYQLKEFLPWFIDSSQSLINKFQPGTVFANDPSVAPAITQSSEKVKESIEKMSSARNKKLTEKKRKMGVDSPARQDTIHIFTDSEQIEGTPEPEEFQELAGKLAERIVAALEYLNSLERTYNQVSNELIKDDPALKAFLESHGIDDNDLESPEPLILTESPALKMDKAMKEYQQASSSQDQQDSSTQEASQSDEPENTTNSSSSFAELIKTAKEEGQLPEPEEVIHSKSDASAANSQVTETDPVEKEKQPVEPTPSQSDPASEPSIPETPKQGFPELPSKKPVKSAPTVPSTKPAPMPPEATPTEEKPAQQAPQQPPVAPLPPQKQPEQPLPPQPQQAPPMPPPVPPAEPPIQDPSPVVTPEPSPAPSQQQKPDSAQPPQPPSPPQPPEPEPEEELDLLEKLRREAQQRRGG